MNNINKNIRLMVQLFFLILIAVISANHILAEKGIQWSFLPNASLHSICPFGGVESLYTLLTEGNLVQKIHESAVVLLGLTLMLSFIFGAVLCGWVCPLGTVQELIGKLGRVLLGKKYNNFVPAKADPYLRFIRYIVLAWVIYITASSAKLVFSDYDPYHALFTFWSGEVAIQSVVILITTLLLSFFIERPWCKYACPFGAVLGLTNYLRIFKIKRQEESCVSCNKCDRQCPMNIMVSETKNVRSAQCITCLQCTSDIACPVHKTVELKI